MPLASCNSIVMTRWYVTRSRNGVSSLSFPMNQAGLRDCLWEKTQTPTNITWVKGELYQSDY